MFPWIMIASTLIACSLFESRLDEGWLLPFSRSLAEAIAADHR